MLLTTTVGLDYVFRGLERVGIVAASLCLRTALYARLAPVANRWNELMGLEIRYPAAHGSRNPA